MLGGFSTAAGGTDALRSEHAGDIVSQPSAAPRAIEDKGAIVSLVAKAVDRLQEVVDQETAALRSRQPVDLKDFNDRKSQGLLELTRALRRLDNPVADQAVLARLSTLRAKLETNRAVLEMHLQAVREISTIMVDAMRDAESDGTYSQSIGNGGNRP